MTPFETRTTKGYWPLLGSTHSMVTLVGCSLVTWTWRGASAAARAADGVWRRGCWRAAILWAGEPVVRTIAITRPTTTRPPAAAIHIHGRLLRGGPVGPASGAGRPRGH